MERNTKLEILCLLSPNHGALLREIAEDINAPNCATVRDLIQQLQADGWRVKTGREKGAGHIAWIDERDWESCKRAGKAYIEQQEGALT